MKPLKIGDQFTNANMPDHHFEIVGILPDLNKCWVEISPPLGYKWIEKDWNLQHTIWGFERGEYALFRYPITQDLKMTGGNFTFLTVFHHHCGVGIAEEYRLKSAAVNELYDSLKGIIDCAKRLQNGGYLHPMELLLVLGNGEDAMEKAIKSPEKQPA